VQRIVGIDREAEELGQLADQHGQGNAVHVAVADRFREQLGDEAETRDARQDAEDPRDHRHHARQSDSAQRVATG
jgi:hypothetical protein